MVMNLDVISVPLIAIILTTMIIIACEKEWNVLAFASLGSGLLGSGLLCFQLGLAQLILAIIALVFGAISVIALKRQGFTT